MAFRLLLLLPPLFWGCSVKKRPELKITVSREQKLKAAYGYQNKAAKAKGYKKAEARLNAARLYLEAGETKKALRSLRRIANDPKSTHRTRARALLLMARHDTPTRSKYLTIITTYPDTVAAEDALDLYLPLVRRDGVRPTTEKLSLLYTKLKNTNLGDNILYKLAQVLDGIGPDNNVVLWGKPYRAPMAAWRCYEKIIKDHPTSSLRDDAIYEGSKLLAKHGKLEAAIAILSSFQKSKSTSWFFGDYNSHLMDDAWLLMAQLYLRKGAFAKGYSMLLGMPKQFPKSRLRDDALWLAVTHSFAKNRPKEGCRALRLFLKSYKQSRYYRQGVTLKRRCAP